MKNLLVLSRDASDEHSNLQVQQEFKTVRSLSLVITSQVKRYRCFLKIGIVLVVRNCRDVFLVMLNLMSAFYEWVQTRLLDVLLNLLRWRYTHVPCHFSSCPKYGSQILKIAFSVFITCTRSCCIMSASIPQRKLHTQFRVSQRY